jgi:hypothetical protein
MRIPTILLALMVTLLATPMTSAQAPAAMQASGALMQLSVDELTPDQVMVTGMIRTTYPPGASVQLTTGSGPSLHYVESGAITVLTGDGAPPTVVRAVTAEGIASPEAASSGGEVVVAAGDGFLLAAGITAEFRNDGADPAAVLDLVAAPDAVGNLGEGVTEAILVSQEATLPQPPVTVTLTLETIEPGGSVTFADDPALTFFAPVDRTQSFSLSAQGANRFADPVDVYLLVIAPAAPG